MSTGNNHRVGYPIRQPPDRFRPVTRLATLPSVKDVRFLLADKRALLRVQRSGLLPRDDQRFQTRTTKKLMFLNRSPSQKIITNKFSLNQKDFSFPTLHPLTATYAQPAFILRGPVRYFPSTAAVVRRTQPILPCERAQRLMLPGRCRRGRWRRPTGSNHRVGYPIRQPPDLFRPVTRLATLPSVKDVRFCLQTNGRFYVFRGVACRHVTTEKKFQTQANEK